MISIKKKKKTFPKIPIFIMQIVIIFHKKLGKKIRPFEKGINLSRINYSMIFFFQDDVHELENILSK